METLNATLKGTPNDTHHGTVHGKDTLSLFLLVPAWGRISVVVFASIMFVIGMIVNIILLAVQYRKKSKGSIDIYLISLAIADVLSLIATCLFSVANFIPGLWSQIGSDVLCRFTAYIKNCGFVISAILVFCIGIDRYFRVLRPYYGGLYKASKIACLLTYITATGICMIFIRIVHENENGICTFNSSYKSVVISVYATMNMGFTVSSFILLGIYIKLAVFLKRRERSKTDTSRQCSVKFNAQGMQLQLQNRPTERTTKTISTLSSNPGPSSRPDEPRGTSRPMEDQERRMKRVAKTTVAMILITIVFFVSTVLPTLGLTLFNSSLITEKSDIVILLMFFSTKLPLVGCVANPILLFIKSSEFRTLTVQMFKSICKKRTNTIVPI